MEDKLFENGRAGSSGNAREEDILQLEAVGPLSDMYHDEGDESLFLGLGESSMGVGSSEIEPTGSPSASRFEALSLQGGGVGGLFSNLESSSGIGIAQPVVGGGIDENEDDPFAMLEAAIEEDKPKTEPSTEWKQMLDSIEADDKAGAPSMVPETAPSTAAASEAPIGNASMDLGEDAAARDAPVLLKEEDINIYTPTEDDGGVSIDGFPDDACGRDRDSMEASGDLAGSAQVRPEQTEEVQSHPSSKTEGEDPAQALDDLRRQAFATFQPICSHLLAHRNDPAALRDLLIELTDTIHSLSPAAVQSCVDYVIFPLQMAVSAIAATRGGIPFNPIEGGGGTDQSAAVALPALRSDKAAEAALEALKALLLKCRCTRGDQLVAVLYRLCGILALPRASAAEEIQLKALEIINAALKGAECDSSLHESLREENSATLVGHLSSLLLASAAAELEQGSVGSKAVRIQALRALHTFIQAIHCPEALSFFLPGLGTGLCRALLAAGSGVRRGPTGLGPAASGTAAVEALGALKCLLVATLGNTVVELILEENASREQSTAGIPSNSFFSSGNDPWVDSTNGLTTSGDAMKALRELSRKKEGKGEVENGDSPPSVTKKAATSPPPPPPKYKEGETPKLRVERTEEWVLGSAAKIKELLKVALPPLAADPRPAVREALVHVCAALLSDCSIALEDYRGFLTDIIFALAQDEWPAVSTAARSWLNPQAMELPTRDQATTASAPSSNASPHGPPPAVRAVAESSLHRWFHELPAALRRGDEAGKAHALKIITCLETCPPRWIVSHLLGNSTHVEELVSILIECFALDAESAGLLLVAVPEAGGAFRQRSSGNNEGGGGGGGGITAVDNNTLPGSSIDHHNDSAREMGVDLTTQTTIAATTTDDALSNTDTALVLPRMPLGLLLISTQKTYTAVAGIVRTLAAVAAAADAQPEGPPGTALRSLIDGCLQKLQQYKESGDGTMERITGRKVQRPGAGVKKKENTALSGAKQATHHASSNGGLSLPWQISAAQTVIVLTEALFGASPAWRPKSITIEDHLRSRSPPEVPFADSSPCPELEALVALVLPLVTDERVWGLPTATTSSFSSSSFLESDSSWARGGAETPRAALSFPSYSPGFTVKDQGCNALLQRVSLDCIGTAARALGLKFSATGRLMRAIILPTLEKLGDPCQLVSSAAESALQAVCAYAGYASKGGLRQLISENADYIVDGLCRQLRQPETYPRAPHLFAALLRQGGVAPGLVTLLAEPARQALMGISIMARRRRPEHVLSFVLCLREIAHGAKLVAQEASLELERLDAVVRERKEALEAALQEESIEKTGNASKTEDASASIDEIGQYFAQHQAKKAQQQQQQEEEDSSIEEERKKVPVTLDEWNDVQVARRKAGSCGSLAQSAADAAGPLALSSSLPVAIQAMRACVEALEALSVASKGAEICSKSIDPGVIPPGGVHGPTESSAATLLPSVHLLWSPLMGSLSDWRIAVVENALAVLSHLAKLAGSFLTRRFEKEAWPVMKRILREGPSQQRLIAPGQDDISSPAVVQRAQRAVLGCLRDLAENGEGPVAVVTPVAAQALTAAAELLGDAQQPAVRESATAAFISLAGVDPDAALALLVSAMRLAAPTAAAAMSRIGSSPPSYLEGSGSVQLPSFAEVCLAPPGSAVPKGLRMCSEAKLQALFREVSEMPVPWHTSVGRASF